MRLLFYTLLLVAFASLLKAQTVKKHPRQQFIKDSTWIMRIKTIRPQLRIDNKITFYEGDRLNINGFDAGVLLKEKFRVAIGYYSLMEDLSTYNRKINGADVGRKLSLRYLSVNVEYIFLNTRFFSLGIPCEFGYGKNELHYYEVNNENVYRQFRGSVGIIDGGFSATFKPIRWVGIRAVVGYRKTIANQIRGFKFDGFFASAGIGINIREINKDVQMFLLKRKYNRLGNPVNTAIDLIGD
jgi:hypothetical protein